MAKAQTMLNHHVHECIKPYITNEQNQFLHKYIESYITNVNNLLHNELQK